MRIALVSPYSWTYPGGVTRHIEALAEQFIAAGHHVRVLAPVDPPGRLSTALHRGARPQELQLPDYVVPLGRTVGFHANGAVSNLSITPYGVATLHHELRTGGYDVVHIHEPVAPLAGWVATDWTRLPLVGTFHSYSDKRLPERDRQPDRRPAGAQPPPRPDRGLRGRGLDGPPVVRRPLPRSSPTASLSIPRTPRRSRRARPTSACGSRSSGQAVPRKGLPLLLRAFEALREHVPAELTVIGPTAEELAPLIVETEGIRVAGQGRRGREAPACWPTPMCCARRRSAARASAWC